MTTLTRRVLAVMLTVSLAGLVLVAARPPAEATTRRYRPTIQVSGTRIHTGDPIVINGRVNLYKGSKRTVTVQVRYDGSKKWKTLRTVSTTKSGSYTTTTHAGNATDRAYRIYKSGKGVTSGYSAIVRVVVDPVITTKSSPVAFATVEQPNPSLDMCTRNVLTDGKNGTTTYTYVDGKLDPARTVTVPAVNKAIEVGTSTVACITDLKPRQALEGATAAVTVTGRNLAGATAITFNGRNGTISSASDTTVTATGPTMTVGTANVIVTVAGVEVPAGSFTVTAKPEIATLKASSGPLSGGNTITITGVGLSTTSKMTFTANGTGDIPLDGMPAIPAKFSVVDDNTLTVKVPSGLGGEATVTATTDFGSASASYTYRTVSRSGSSWEQQVLAQINLRRAAGGVCGATVMPAVPALAWDGGLSDLALSHARDMADNWDLYDSTFGGISHTTPGLAYLNYRFYLAGHLDRPVAENIAMVLPERTASDLVSEWAASEVHCRAIFSASSTSAGVGADVRADGAEKLVVVNFE